MISTNLRWVRASHGELGEAGDVTSKMPYRQMKQQNKEWQPHLQGKHGNAAIQTSVR